MKTIRFLTYISFLIFTVNCSLQPETPQYSIIPEIEFKDIYFKRGNMGGDTLMLKINFTDGDRDFGLDPKSYLEPPFQQFNYFLKNDGSYLTLSDRETPPYDTLPPYEYPYKCYNYIFSIEEGDYLYVQRNPNFYNLFVDFYTKKNGAYQFFDWTTYDGFFCNEPYYSRVWVANSLGIPLQSGTIAFPMTRSSFEVVFKDYTCKLKIHVQDKALHKSNIIETPEFTFQSIKIN